MNKHIICLASIAASFSTIALAEGNMPLVQTKYTADPAPIVRNDTIYLYSLYHLGIYGWDYLLIHDSVIII